MRASVTHLQSIFTIHERETGLVFCLYITSPIIGPHHHARIICYRTSGSFGLSKYFQKRLVAFAGPILSIHGRPNPEKEPTMLARICVLPRRAAPL